jgi:hypothetical protein
MSARPVVVSVSSASTHSFSKNVRPSIRLVEGQGIESDAHAGPFVQHRYLARWSPRKLNEKQVHLIEAELFEKLAREGFSVGPGQLGENVNTRGVDLRRLPFRTRVHLGPEAVVELRGLRTPCVLIDRFQKGLLKALVQKSERPRFRAGVMATVIVGGLVQAGDTLSTQLPTGPQKLLPEI